MFTPGKSIRQDLSRNVRFEPLPSKIEFIPGDFVRQYPPNFVDQTTIARPPSQCGLSDVFVDRWANLTSKGRLHPSGWDFERKTLVDHLRHAWRWIHAKRQAQAIGQACFVMPHLVFGGSYGDYWLETLVPLAYHRPDSGSVVLFFDRAHADFAAEDLKDLRLEAHLVSGTGVNVKKLTILEPPQFHGNFTAESVERLRAAFPSRCQSTTIRGKKVYLSRAGYERQGGNPATKRFIGNSEEVEVLLAKRGFTTLRTHEVSNAQIREGLKGAEVVVAEHGAAMFHLLWSPPELLVELVANGWFAPCFVKMTPHLSTKRHVVLAARESSRIPMDVLAAILP